MQAAASSLAASAADKGSPPASALSSDLMGTSPNTTMMNAPNLKDEYYM
jgi:hypothetical protein